MEPVPPNAPRKRERRERKTRRSVLLAEWAARTAITVGGVLTIVAVSMICVFLVWVAAPLFRTAEISAARSVPVPSAPRNVAATQIDEYAALLWTLYDDGELEVRRLDSGEKLASHALLEGARPTAIGVDAQSGSIALGAEDGTVRLATLEFVVSYPTEETAPAHLQQLAAGQFATHEGGLVERTTEGQLRRVVLETSLSAPFDVSAGGGASAVVLVDLNVSETNSMVSALFADGRLSIGSLRRSTNLMTGEETLRLRGGVLPHQPEPGAEAPIALRILGTNDNVLLVWRDGRTARFDVRDVTKAAEAEVFDLTPEDGAQITAFDAVLGERTVVVGDSKGRSSGWFRTRPEEAGTLDGARMVRGHEFEGRGSAVVALAVSPASRSFAIGTQDGEIEMYFMTSEKLLARTRVENGGAIRALCIAPRENALVAHTERGLSAFRIVSHHPESSVSSLFQPVWYESYERPEHVWQSSSGTDDFEAKLGLMPLIFGTLKATFYSLLFGVPLALLAAVFSSEFLAPRTRVAVKSTIEVMASLPSVVLGFLAGNVVAPLVQDSLAAVIASFYCVPVALLLGARLWQLVPQRLGLRLSSWQRFAVIAVAVPVGLLAGAWLGPRVESAYFGGNLEAWLDHQHGGATAGWFLMLLPIAAIGAALAFGRLLGPWMRRISLKWSRARCAQFDLARFLATGAAAALAAWLVARLLDSLGFDPRGSIVDTYVQRNALVVGFIMGFAIIPIIYTLAEDALTSVPEQLRQASLGAGATPWQTALRVIVPTAASGLFSAVMVGLGRAVGETMIVLMAAGNTPVMHWNIFSGFRTLSANIAVELPEAVEGDTHYRTLFLAALALFAMTFVVNTAAEVVRQRFRRRAFQL